jgi:osmotically-inducible protein OsmY
MKTKSQLQQEVLEELEFDPTVNASEIGVSLKDEVVVLSGFVKTFVEKSAAEDAAKRVLGVTAVANDIVVRPSGSLMRDDVSIAEAAHNALKWNVIVPDEKIKVSLDGGWITLDGEVPFNYQKAAAATAVANLAGVRGVTNRITIKPSVRPLAVKDQIERAFKRAAHFEADRIRIEVDGGKVTLRGDVATWAEKADAGRGAWSVPGVSSVVNDLHVTGGALAGV